MSYLALNAAPFSSEDTSNMSSNMSSKLLSDPSYTTDNELTSIQKFNKNRTIKNYSNNKVKNMMENIHNTIMNDDDNLGNFNPPEKPISIGSENKKETEIKYENTPPQKQNENEDDAIDEDSYNQMNPSMNNQMNPSMNNQMNSNENHYYNSENEYIQKLHYDTPSVNNKDDLTDKLNYMIQLLEEQKDEKVGNVTEELILYSFLGIFIIYVVDSFARAGKYIR
jgi:hypothetical protein